jgi:hypothetical protein
MNVDTGHMGFMDDVVRAAKPGERVIPAILIPEPKPKPLTYGRRKPLREVRKDLRAAAELGATADR